MRDGEEISNGDRVSAIVVLDVARWTVDLEKVAGGGWMRTVEDRLFGEILAATGWYDDDKMIRIVLLLLILL